VDIAKFVLAAIGTFLSVAALSFTVFQYWRKKQDEKFELLKKSLETSVQEESNCRKEAISRIDERLYTLESTTFLKVENRLGGIEGELRIIKSTLQAIQGWFINNTGSK
jgi:hypothetical protein